EAQILKQTMQSKYLYRLIFILPIFIFIVGFKLFTSGIANSSLEIYISQNLFAIKNVNVITMTSGSDILTNVTVVIKDGKIISLNGAIPDSAYIINGNGKWLIPGLIDMHAHTLTDGHFNATY